MECTVRISCSPPRTSLAPSRFVTPLPVVMIAAVIFAAHPHGDPAMASGCPPGNCSQYEVEVCQTGCTYSTITAAINSFATGTVGPIVVRAGTYRERVDLNNRAGTCECPTRIRADGNVIIDARNIHLGTWTHYSGDVYFTTYVVSVPEQAHVFVNDTPYTYAPGTSFGGLVAQHYGYDASTERLYAHFGGLDPSLQVIAISTQTNGIRMNEASRWLIVEGFNVIGARDPGILLKGTAQDPVSDITVKGCTSSFNSRQGIHLEYATDCRVESSKAHDNGRHGVYVYHSQECAVVRNESFRNDNPQLPGILGNAAGIKIGDSPDSADVSTITVDYNVVHDNEDTGIAIRGARQILVRRNVSYRNGDHGFDNDETNQTVFINNVAALNDHDGISVESTAHNVEIYNNILAFNGIDGETLNPTRIEDIGELFVAGTNGFASNNNVFWSYGPWTFANGSNRMLMRYAGTSYNNLAPYQSASAQDAASRWSDPVFADTLNAVFTVGGIGSEALDRAKTNMAGWLSPWWLAVDPRGFVAHDVCDSVVANAGSGTVEYADIGAYEFDPRPGKTTDVTYWGSTLTSAWLRWTATRDDSTVGCKVDSADVRYSTSPIVTEQQFQAANRSSTVLVPVTPNGSSQQTFQVTGLTACTQYHFAVKVRADENGHWSDLADTANIWTMCGGGHCPNPPCQIDGISGPCVNPPCEGEPVFRAVSSKSEGTDLPLALSWASPNPSRGVTRVGWSIPRGEEGAPFDLSVFDIAGRRVAQIASGIARAGAFEQEVSFDTRNGARLPNGVLFVRLRVGMRFLHRTVVVAR